MLKLRNVSIWLLGGALLAACSDDKDSPNDGAAGKKSGDVSPAGKKGQPDASGNTNAGGAAANEGGARAEAGAGGNSATNTPEPLYVASLGVISGDDYLGYLVPVRSLDASTKVTLDEAAELSGGSFIFNRPGNSSVYVASLFDPTIVRWEVEDDGKLVKHETVSFANLGVLSASSAALTPVFSAQKSYFADEEQDEIVIWNPEAMEVIGSIPLGDDDQGNLHPAPESAILVRDDRLLVTIGWRDADDTTLLGDHVRVVTIDTKTDTIVDSKLEDRNVHAALNSVGSDGTAYYSAYSLYAAYTEIGTGHGAGFTGLRILPGATSFDADYALDLSKLVGGRPAGDFTLLDDETALIRAWHPEIVDKVDPDAWQDVLWNEAGFNWWRWHIGDDQAVEIENQEPGAQAGTIFKIGDKTYTIRYADDLSSTALIEITPQGEFVPSITAPGAIVGAGVLRVR